MSGTEIFAIAMALLNGVAIPVLMRLFSDVRDAEKKATTSLALAQEGKEIALEFAEKLNVLKLHIAQDYLSVQTFEKVFEKFEKRVIEELESIKADMRANRP